MGLPMTETRFDADAYLAWEADQPGKSEFVAGEVFAMLGVRRAHATVAPWVRQFSHPCHPNPQ